MRRARKPEKCSPGSSPREGNDSEGPSVRNACCPCQDAIRGDLILLLGAVRSVIA